MQFYERDEELVETVGAHLGDGLRVGEVALVVATRAHTRTFETALTADGISVVRAREDGSLITHDAGETLSRFMLGDGPDTSAFDAVIGGVVRQASQSGRRIRAYGEMVALLWDDGHVAAAIELETLWSELGLQVPFSLLCAYPTRAVTGEDRTSAFHQVCHLHSAVVGSSTELIAELDVTGTPTSRAFSNTPRAPRAARHFVVETLSRWGREVLVADAAVVVTELATSAVVHAQSDFTVTVPSRAREVCISVRDASDVLPILRDLALAEMSGRGVALVAALARRRGIDRADAGKVVWAEFLV